MVGLVKLLVVRLYRIVMDATTYFIVSYEPIHVITLNYICSIDNFLKVVHFHFKLLDLYEILWLDLDSGEKNQYT